MPNPLSKVRRNAKPHYGPGSLEKRPELALMVVECIALWSHIEAAMGRLLAHMLGASAAVPAVAMFHSLTSGAARLDALQAAASATLDGEHLIYLDAGMRYARKLASQRHNFAHQIWGVCEELPEALLLIDPKEMAELAVRQKLFEAGGSDEDMFALILEGVLNLKNDKVMVYLKSDFEAFHRTAHNAAIFMGILSLLLNRRDDLGPQEIRVLKASPEFQTVLSA